MADNGSLTGARLMADLLGIVDLPQVTVQLVGHPLHGKRCVVVETDGDVVFVRHASLPEPIGFHPTHLVGYARP